MFEQDNKPSCKHSNNVYNFQAMLAFQSKLSTMQLRLSVVTRVEDFKVRKQNFEYGAKATNTPKLLSCLTCKSFMTILRF